MSSDGCGTLETLCRWLCEWSYIPIEADTGPGTITAAGVEHILQARAASMQRCSFVICVGTDIQLEERTLKLGGYDGHCSRISWDDFLLPLACPGSTLLVASFRLPGEAAAGIAKLPAALDGKDVSSVFQLARDLLSAESCFRKLWSAFLEGCKIFIVFHGSTACFATCQRFVLLKDFGWHCQQKGPTEAFLFSDGAELRGFSGLFHFN